MSAIDTRKRINKVDVIKLQCFDECKSYDDNECTMGDELLSPITIRTEFVESYYKLVNELIAKETDQLQAMKLAFTTLAIQKYRTADILTLKSEIAKTMNSDTIEEFSNGMKIILPEMEQSHGLLFEKVLGEACEKAAMACNYTETTFEKNDEMTRIIAKNKYQQIIISEISMDPSSKDFIIRTETIGLKGNQCEKILDRFDGVLRGYGITNSCKSRILKQQNPSINSSFSIMSNNLKKRFLRAKHKNHQQQV